MGAQYVPQVNHLAVEMARWLEEWRMEAIPERDDLLGGTDGDNVRHVLIRGAFLDHFFGDKKINAIIEGWVNRTPLRASVQQLERILDELAKSSKIPLNEIPWDEKCGFSIATDETAEISVVLSQRATEILRACLDEVQSFPRSKVFRTVLNDIVELVESLDMPYQWLVIELAQVYFARLFISDYSWQYAGNLEVQHSSDFQPTPEVDFRFQTLAGETVKQAVDRLNSEVGQVTDALTRFVEHLPRGKMPNQTQPILIKHAEWLYRNKVAGESIRSIALQEYPGESDRRKDVRDGLSKAQELLSLGRLELPPPETSCWQPGGVEIDL